MFGVVSSPKTDLSARPNITKSAGGVGIRDGGATIRWNNDQYTRAHARARSAINQSRACVQLVNSLKRFPPSVILASAKLYPAKTFFLPPTTLSSPRRHPAVAASFRFAPSLPLTTLFTLSPTPTSRPPSAPPVRSFILHTPSGKVFYAAAAAAAMADGDAREKKPQNYLGMCFGLDICKIIMEIVRAATNEK